MLSTSHRLRIGQVLTLNVEVGVGGRGVGRNWGWTSSWRGIERGCVGEEEYESLYAQYFPQTQDRTGIYIECQGCGGSCIVGVVVEGMDMLGD